MRLNLVRSTGIVVGFIAILLIAPTICAASMDMTAETHALIPQGSSISNSPLSHHVLINAVGEQVIPSRLIPSEAFCLSWSPVGLTAESSLTEERPAPREVIDHAPPSKPIGYRCRNYLTSEEPPL